MHGQKNIKYITISRSFHHRVRNVSEKYVEKIKPRISFSIRFFENLGIYEVMWKKYCRAGRTTDDNMAHAHCMLDT